VVGLSNTNEYEKTASPGEGIVAERKYAAVQYGSMIAKEVHIENTWAVTQTGRTIWIVFWSQPF